MFVRIKERKSCFEYQAEDGKQGYRDYKAWNLCEALDRLFVDLDVTSYEILWRDGAVAEGCIAPKQKAQPSL